MVACLERPEVVAVALVGSVGHGHAAQERLLAFFVAPLLAVRARILRVVPAGEEKGEGAERRETAKAGSLMR